MEWNNKQEEILIGYGENAKVYKWLHRKSYANLLWWDKLLGVSSILAGFGTGTTSLSAIASSQSDYNLVITISGLVSGFLTSLTQFLKLKEKARVHSDVAKKYNNLALEIQYTLSLKRTDRGNAMRYMKETKDKLSVLDAESPDISKSILEAFEKKFKNSKIMKPDIVGELDQIEKASADSESEEINVDSSLQESFNKMKEKHVGNI